MNNYKKPELIVVDDLAEGVYASSGSSGRACDSQYMGGVFTKGTGNPATDGFKVGLGCLECPANWGDSCARDNPYFNDNRTLVPTWERLGRGPDQKGYDPYNPF